jgi:hypothetical protein
LFTCGSVTSLIVTALSATGVLAVTAFAVPYASASTAPKGVTLSGIPLGVNVAPWQTADIVTSSRQRMDGYLKQLDRDDEGVRLVRQDDHAAGRFSDDIPELVRRSGLPAG